MERGREAGYFNHLHRAVPVPDPTRPDTQTRKPHTTSSPRYSGVSLTSVMTNHSPLNVLLIRSHPRTGSSGDPFLLGPALRVRGLAAGLLAKWHPRSVRPLGGTRDGRVRLCGLIRRVLFRRLIFFTFRHSKSFRVSGVLGRSYIRQLSPPAEMRPSACDPDGFRPRGNPVLADLPLRAQRRG